MNGKVKRFNHLMLNELRGYVKGDYAVFLLINLYLLKFVREYDATVDLLTSNLTIKEQLVHVYSQISPNNPALESALSFSDKAIKEGDIASVAKSVNEVPFSEEEIRSAIENLVALQGDDSSTPESINRLGIRLLSPISGSFYDGSAGVHGTVITANDYVTKRNSSLEFYTQELSPASAAIGAIRAFIHGIKDIHITIGDTITEPSFVEGNSLKQFDYIMMNFPSGAWKYDKKLIDYDIYSRFEYGVPSKSSIEWLFISHILKSLKPEGKAVAIVSSSALFASNTKTLRRNLIKDDLIEAVISLPEKLYTNTSIPVNLIIFNRDKPIKQKILFINAEDIYTSKSRSQNVLKDPQIDKIVDLYENKDQLDEVSKLVSIYDLSDNLLLPSKYVAKKEIEVEEFGKIKMLTEGMEKLSDWPKIKDIALVYRGINSNSSNCKLNQKSGEYAIIKLADVQNNQLQLDNIIRYDIENAKTENYIAQPGDILVSSRGSAIKLCIIPEHEGLLLVSQNFLGIRPIGSYSSEFIMEYLLSPLGQYLIANEQLGSTTTVLNIKDLQEIQIVNMPRLKQEEILNNFKEQLKVVEDEIMRLENEKKQLKLKLYEEMGIKDTFKLTED